MHPAIKTVMRSVKRRTRQLETKVESRIVLRRDRATGLYSHQFFGRNIYVRTPRDYVSCREALRLCEDVYFKRYLPKLGETVVDIGAGFGHEALYLSSQVGDIRYIGVEVQPSVYECLANTFSKLGSRWTAFPAAIADDENLWISTSADYETVEAVGNGPVQVATISWGAFLKKFDLRAIDLLKVNIEGGEKPLLECIPELSVVRRVIISAHDFRADLGDGERFRTREFVVKRLQAEGFRTQPLGAGTWWEDWIYGEKVA
jgi:FkbM family methyltransferase